MGWAAPPPPPAAMAGVFGLFDGADDDDDDDFGLFAGLDRPAPRRPAAAPRRRFQAAHDDLRARIEGARARRQVSEFRWMTWPVICRALNHVRASSA